MFRLNLNDICMFQNEDLMGVSFLHLFIKVRGGNSLTLCPLTSPSPPLPFLL